GFPMTLLEYGMAGLPTVATQVGQCSEVLDGGRAGILISPESPTQLANAILELLQAPDRRKLLGKQLNLHVQEKFNQDRIVEKFASVMNQFKIVRMILYPLPKGSSDKEVMVSAKGIF